MITNFPSGLVWEDIEELCELKSVSPGWEEVLARLLSQDQESKKSEGEEDVVEEVDEEAEGDEEIGRNVSEPPKIKPGNYFWITIAKGPHSTLHLKPAQSIYQFITKNLRNEFPELQFAKLEYLTLFALNLIERAKTNYFYNEQLIENSLVCEHGVWVHRGSNSFYKKHLDGGMTAIYLQGMSFDGMKELGAIFQEHETNFLSCFDLDVIKSLLSMDGKH